MWPWPAGRFFAFYPADSVIWEAANGARLTSTSAGGKKTSWGEINQHISILIIYH